MASDFGDSLERIDAAHVQWRGRRWRYFGGCDYLGLSFHPRIRKVLSRGAINVAASRMTTGNHPVYAEVEARVRAHFRAGTATLCSSGYLAVIAAGQALTGEVEEVLIDQRAHGCLWDAARLIGCRVRPFRHRDAVDLKRKVRTGRPLVMTDGVFATDGAIAPLREYLEVMPAEGRLLVDDAHAAGVLGKNGRGTWEHWRLPRGRMIQTVTFSKAFGVYGGAVLGDRHLRRRLLDQSRAVIGNTPLPPMLAGAIPMALQLADRARRERLREHAAMLPGGPVFPVWSLVTERPRRIIEALEAAGIHPPFIRYPGGAEGGCFRFAVTSGHRRAQLRDLVAVLRELVQ
jgi:8-amino-7-oxononanoate synthase